jgi:hypothetical protein
VIENFIDPMLWLKTVLRVSVKWQERTTAAYLAEVMKPIAETRLGTLSRALIKGNAQL